jgi:hypothetical protein
MKLRRTRANSSSGRGERVRLLHAKKELGATPDNTRIRMFPA